MLEEEDYNWRDEIATDIFYKRKFATIPVCCSDGSTVWFKHYYAVYRGWVSGKPFPSYSANEYHHKEFIENITNSECLARKLIGSL